MLMCAIVFFFFKQKTAYEMRISDWSSDVCSSDLARRWFRARGQAPHHDRHLCAVGGLLRCLLHAGAEGADADRARFRTGFCKLRRDPRADRAVGGVRAGRKERRSAGDVLTDVFDLTASTAGLPRLPSPPPRTRD